MRKFFIILLSCLIPVVALAHSFAVPDVSSLSNEDLTELNRQVQLELISRAVINGVRVPAGRYVIGEDIPAGTYRVELINPEFAIASTFMLEDPVWFFYTLTSDNYEIGKVQFDDGVTLRIEAAVMLYPYTGIIH